MDDIDRASEREEQLKAEALSKRMPEGPKATGYCLQCGGVMLMECRGESGMVRRVPDFDRRWCNAQCRDDWERAQTKG